MRSCVFLEGEFMRRCGAQMYSDPESHDLLSSAHDASVVASHFFTAACATPGREM